MKKYYELEIKLVLLKEQDVVRTSIGFEGEGDGFAPPNSTTVGEF